MPLGLLFLFPFLMGFSSLEIIPAISTEVEHPTEETVEDIEEEVEKAEEAQHETQQQVADAVGEVAEQIHGASELALTESAADLRHNAIMDSLSQLHTKLDTHGAQLGDIHGILNTPVEEVEHTAEHPVQSAEGLVQEIEPEHIEAEVKKTGRRMRWGRR